MPMEQGAQSCTWLPSPRALPTKPQKELGKLLENQDSSKLLEEIKAIGAIQAHLGHECLVQEFFNFFHSKLAAERKETWMRGLQLLLVAAVSVEMPSTVARQESNQEKELWKDIDSALLVVHLAYQVFGISNSCLLRHDRLPDSAWTSLPMKILWYAGSGLRAGENCPGKYSVVHSKTDASMETMVPNEFQALPVKLDTLKDPIKLRFLSAEITSLGIFLATDPPMKMNSFILVKEGSVTTVVSPASFFFLQPLEYDSYQQNGFPFDVSVRQDGDLESNFQRKSLLKEVTTRTRTSNLVNETFLLHGNYASQLVEQVMHLAFPLLKSKRHKVELTRNRPVSTPEVKGGLTFLESMQNSASKICIENLLQSLKKISDDTRVIHTNAKEACHDLYRCLISLHCDFVEFQRIRIKKSPRPLALGSFHSVYKSWPLSRESMTTDLSLNGDRIGLQRHTSLHSLAAGKRRVSKIQKKTVKKSLSLDICSPGDGLEVIIGFSSALSTRVMNSVLNHLLSNRRDRQDSVSNGILSRSLNQSFDNREDNNNTQDGSDDFKIETDSREDDNKRIALSVYCECLTKRVMNSALVEIILDNDFPSALFVLQKPIYRLGTLDLNLWPHAVPNYCFFFV